MDRLTGQSSKDWKVSFAGALRVVYPALLVRPQGLANM